MRILFVVNLFLVLVMELGLQVLLPVLWRAVQDVTRLEGVLQEWQVNGLQKTLIGQFRERLAVSGWLASPRDPLHECNVPLDHGWRRMLRLMPHASETLTCVEEQITLAHREQRTFINTILLTATSCTFCLLMWVWTRLKLTRRHDHCTTTSDGDLTNTHTNGSHSKEADTTLHHKREVKHMLVKTSKTWPTEATDTVQKESLFSPLWSPTAGLLMRATNLQTQHNESHKKEEEQTESIVRRSQKVNLLFWQEFGGLLRDNLQRQHSVIIYMDQPKKKIHIKGLKKNAEECYRSVKTLLAEWRPHNPPPVPGHLEDLHE